MVVVWTTRLLVLGLVRWLQPVHGYLVQRELLSWGVESWAEIKRGSIYHALKRLTAEGHLEVVSTERIAGRPARTTYRMTRRGEVEFQASLRERLWDTDMKLERFWVPWSFITVLSHREAAAVLRNRAAALRSRSEDLRDLLERRSDSPYDADFLPRHVAQSTRLQATVLEDEIDWCLATADQVEAGELYSEAEYTMSERTADLWKAHIAGAEHPEG